MIESMGIEGIFRAQARSLAMGGHVEPSEQEGAEALASRLLWAAEHQSPLTVKLSLDRSYQHLHLGHMVILRKLRGFQDLGHQAIIIPGGASDFLFGNDSDFFKTEAFLEQIGKVVDLRRGRVFYPEALLTLLSLEPTTTPAARMAALLQVAGEIELLKPLATYQTENLAPDQLESLAGNPVFEALFQGVAAALLKTDVEMITTEGLLAFQMGREIQEAKGAAFPQVGVWIPHLESIDGQTLMPDAPDALKILMSDSPETMYEKLVQIPNALVFRYEALLTPITPEQLDEQMQLMERSPVEGGLRAQDLKSHLAKWLVSQYHSPEESDRAEQHYLANKASQ